MAAHGGSRVPRDGIVSIVDPFARKEKDKNLLAEYFPAWELGAGSASSYSQNGDGNSRIIDTNPWGAKSIIWDVSNQDAASNADGGWVTSSFPVDEKKMYRFSVWVKRKVTGNGSFYLGLYGYVNGTNGVHLSSNTSNYTNPYFSSRGWWGNNSDWYLVVGHVWPSDAGNVPYHPDSGGWTTSGQKLFGCTDFKWKVGTNTARHRTYLYYSTSTSTNQQFYNPRVDACDGTEPSLKELLGNGPTNLERNVKAVDPSTRSVGRSRSRWGSYGIILNGSNEYVEASLPINPSQPYTVLMWCKPNSLGTGTSSSVRKTPLKGNGHWNPGIWCTQNIIRSHCKNEYRDNSINWGDLGWKLIGMVFDGTNCWNVFDGKLLTGGTRYSYAPGTPSTYIVGAESLTGSATNWNGQVSNVMFWQKALNKHEVRKVKAARSGMFK